MIFQIDSPSAFPRIDKLYCKHKGFVQKGFDPALTLSELTELTLSACRANCKQVAKLQYYGSEGPFAVAMNEINGEPNFFCFSFADTDEFLAHPGALPLALESEDFPFAMLGCLELAHLENTYKYYPFTYNKIVPDEPACRLAVQQLWHTNAKAASLISLMGADSQLLSSNAVRQNPSLLS